MAVTSEVAGGFAVYGQTALSDINMPVLVVDAMCADARIVETDENASSANVDCFAKLGDYPRSLADGILLRAFTHASNVIQVNDAA